LERLVWTGKMPFEVKTMEVKPGGFDLTFTKPVDPKSAGKTDSYNLETYTYIFQSSYGSPEVDHTQPTIKKVTVSDDGLYARLQIDELQKGHVHELHLPGVRSGDGQPLLHPVAYYTLMNMPEIEETTTAQAAGN
jgi:hypothetical protein